MKKYIIVFIGVVIFCACNTSKDPVPKDILNVNKMSEIMVDIQLLEASLNLNISPKELSTMDAIFKKHLVSKKEFNKSFKYYTNNLDSLNRIYELVLDELTKQQALLKVEKNDQTKDSIITKKDTIKLSREDSIKQKFKPKLFFKNAGGNAQ